MRLRKPVRSIGSLLVLAVPLGLLAAVPQSQARLPEPVPVTGYQLPFTCNEAWSGGTRARHSPSPHAVDFNRAADLGKSVVAAAAGVVTTADQAGRGGYGRHVVIDHGNGESTVYAHLQNVTVSAGASVDQGALIGAVGSTGNTSGPHLHFEQKVGKRVVPAYFGRLPFVSSTLASANCVDVPLAGNVVPGPAAELAVFRRTRKGDFHLQQAGGAPVRVVRFGGGTNEPLLGDWDGDGLADPAVWNPRGRKFRLGGPIGAPLFRFGSRGDRPVAGDWDGDGRSEVGVFRPSTATFHLRSAAGAVTQVPLGGADDVPVTGDWNGDRRTDVGTYDRATSVFTLRHVDAAGTAVVTTVAFGLPGDLPVAGDWDGNGTSEVGTWTPATAVFSLRQSGDPTGAARAVANVQFGRAR